MYHFRIKESITPVETDSVRLFFKDISKYKLLSPEEQVDLVIEAHKGNKAARDKLINHNLRFCASISKQYLNKGVLFEDLISSASIGLMKAVDTYNPDYGCKFISYASWWIRDAILKEILDHGKQIRIPPEKVTKLNKINRYIAKFEQETSRPPSIREIADYMEVDDQTVKDILSQSSITLLTENNPNPKGEDESLFETLYIEEGNTDREMYQQSASTTIINFLKKNLNPIEYEVISKYFGLEGLETSLEVIGEQNGITKERVRQIKDKAIIKLRKSDGIELLSNFL